MTNRSTQEFLLQAELDAANATNNRLARENERLRAELERINGDEKSKSTLAVESRLRAFKMEDERDRMYENLEKLKRRYNQLHEAFLQKLKRCKALEEVFTRQKALTGLVMKVGDSRTPEEQKVTEERMRSSRMKQTAAEALQNQVASLKKELAESYDVIDEMEFELESIDFLELENQRLQDELFAYKRDPKSNVINLRNDEDSAPPPKYSEIDGGLTRGNTDSIASSLAESFAGDMDAETIERAALTESLIKNVEIESNCLRRELLRSRLQRTNRDVRPTSSDA